MKLTKRKLKQIINEEFGQKFNNNQLNEIIGTMAKRLFGKESKETIELNLFEVPFEVKVYDANKARLFDSNGKARGTEVPLGDVIDSVSRFLRNLKSIESNLSEPAELPQLPQQPQQPPKKHQPLIPPRPQFNQK